MVTIISFTPRSSGSSSPITPENEQPSPDLTDSRFAFPYASGQNRQDNRLDVMGKGTYLWGLPWRAAGGDDKVPVWGHTALPGPTVVETQTRPRPRLPRGAREEPSLFLPPGGIAHPGTGLSSWSGAGGGRRHPPSSPRDTGEKGQCSR